MKTIEKVTRDGDTQYFQNLTKKEMAETIRDLYSGAVEDGIYTDEDSSAVWYLKDGSSGFLSGGWEAPKKPAIAKIEKFVYYNAGDTQIWGKVPAPVQNPRYGDWEIEL
jgi:hypothetical protein